MKSYYSWRPVYLCSFLVIFLSVIPTPTVAVASGRDKIGHFAIYGLLAFITLVTAARNKIKRPGPAVFAYAFGLGLFLEMVQFFLPYREFQLGDILANSLGSLSGIVLAARIK